MPIALIFFVHYAYLIIFLWVLIEQIGIPIPSVPVLLTAGTLSATHRVSWIAITLAMLLACIVADSVWFALGRRYGNSVLKLLCRFSFEASTCVSKTEGYFTRRGAVTLLGRGVQRVRGYQDGGGVEDGDGSRRAAGRLGSRPSSSSRPDDGGRTVASMRSSEVLPAPFGPSRPRTPGPACNVTPLTAGWRPKL